VLDFRLPAAGPACELRPLESVLAVNIFAGLFVPAVQHDTLARHARHANNDCDAVLRQSGKALARYAEKAANINGFRFVVHAANLA
jgi:hypothetical protein